MGVPVLFDWEHESDKENLNIRMHFSFYLQVSHNLKFYHRKKSYEVPTTIILVSKNTNEEVELIYLLCKNMQNVLNLTKKCPLNFKGGHLWRTQVCKEAY